MRFSILFIFIIAMVGGVCSADVIQLKSGQEIQGKILKKTEIGIEVYLEKEKAKKFYMLTLIKAINSIPVERVYASIDPQKQELFFGTQPKSEKTGPMEMLRLKNGKEIQGVIIERNPYYVRIHPEGQNAVQEILLDQIASQTTLPGSVPIPAPRQAPTPLLANSENLKYLNGKDRAAYRESFGVSLVDQKEVPEKKSILSKAGEIYELTDRDNPKTELEIGSEYSWIKYKEPDSMQEKGNMYSVYGIFTYRLKDNSNIISLPEALKDENKYNVFRVDTRLSSGKVDYDSQGTGAIDNIDDVMIEVRTLFGYEYPATKDLKLMPYFGLGYRFLRDKFDGTSDTGSWGYDRASRYYYMPIGLETRVNLKKSWSLGLTLEYDYFLDGTQKSYLGDGGLRIQSATTGQWYTYDTLVNDQDKGFGLRGSLKVMKLANKVDFYIEPFVRYWKIGESDPKQFTSNGGMVLWYLDSGYTIPYQGVEPKNSSLEYGIRLGAHF